MDSTKFSPSLKTYYTETLKLPASAVEFLISVFEVCQVLDDFMDDDLVTKEEINSTVLQVFYSIPANLFYLQNVNLLSPILLSSVVKWQAANQVEANYTPSPMSFVWRAGYYDLVLQCVIIVHGYEKAQALAPKVMELYGESYEDYLQEFSHA